MKFQLSRLINFKYIKDLLRFCYWVAMRLRLRRLIILCYRCICLPFLLWKIKRKKKIKVVFTAWNLALWKYGGIYELMERHPRFDPVIIINPPLARYSGRETEQDIVALRCYFEQKKYNFLNTVVYEQGFCSKEISAADFVFFTQPYFFGNLNFSTIRQVFCYCPYSINSVKEEKWMFDSLLQNLAWKIFQPTQQALFAAKKLSFVKGRNCVYSGHTLYDDFQNSNNDRIKKSIWKPQNKIKKRIIWATHFSITSQARLNRSNFLRLSESFFDLIEEFKDEVQWAFKPHPFLFSELCKNESWGESRAKNYFEKWQHLMNGQLESGSYLELFLSSDAIIHDCASFTIEYFYTKNPAMFLAKHEGLPLTDSLGQEALKCHYIGVEIDEIRSFIRDVIIGGNDPKRNLREMFYQKNLLPPNGKSVAQNILDNIEIGLGWK